MARGRGGGGLFELGDYLKIFRSKGAITRGTAIIRGNTVSVNFTTEKCYIYTSSGIHLLALGSLVDEPLDLTLHC